MSTGVAVSIVLCTRDRAASLAATLTALERVAVPATLPTELVVVDNGSRDDTAAIAQAAILPALSVRCVREDRAGVGRARNAGVRAARGDIVAFVDDDVRPEPDWLFRLCAPIVDGRADAVAGGVRLAPALLRPWMESLHRCWLASTEYIDADHPQEFASANAAFHRRVLTRVPAFDPELGSPAHGQGEDALFSWQLLRAGFRLVAALDVTVEHHVEPSRLSAASFRQQAIRKGRSMAYQQHHWEHAAVPNVTRGMLITTLRYARRRLTDGAIATSAQLLALERLAFLLHWRTESRRPRNYERHGLVKLRGVLP